MADESTKEFAELREQIGRLSTGEQCRLLELVLADNHRRHRDLVAETLAAQAELLSYLEAQRNRASETHGEDMREAG